MVKLLGEDQRLAADTTREVHDDRALRQRLPVKSFKTTPVITIRSHCFYTRRTFQDDVLSGEFVESIHSSGPFLVPDCILGLAQPLEERQVASCCDVESGFVRLSGVGVLGIEQRFRDVPEADCPIYGAVEVIVVLETRCHLNPEQATYDNSNIAAGLRVPSYLESGLLSGQILELEILI